MAGGHHQPHHGDHKEGHSHEHGGHQKRKSSHAEDHHKRRESHGHNQHEEHHGHDKDKRRSSKSDKHERRRSSRGGGENKERRESKDTEKHSRKSRDEKSERRGSEKSRRRRSSQKDTEPHFDELEQDLKNAREDKTEPHRPLEEEDYHEKRIIGSTVGIEEIDYHERKHNPNSTEDDVIDYHEKRRSKDPKDLPDLVNRNLMMANIRKPVESKGYSERKMIQNQDPKEDKMIGNVSLPLRHQEDVTSNKGNPNVNVHVPFPPPHELGPNAQLQEIQPIETDYPGHHHERWYFFWPPGSALPGTPGGPPIGTEPPAHPYPPPPSVKDVRVGVRPLAKSQVSSVVAKKPVGKTSDKGQSTNTQQNKDASASAMFDHNSNYVSRGASAFGSEQNFSVTEAGSVVSNAPMRVKYLSPKGKSLSEDICSTCSLGRYKKKVTTAGYLAAILLFPIGTYACLRKKWCVAETCNYCGHFRP